MCDFGKPKTVLMDNGGEFTSQQFKTLMAQCEIQMAYTTPYHPRGNSVTERMHRTLKTVLATICSGHPNNWPRSISECQRILNTAVHTTIGEQPYFAFFNRHALRNVGVDLPEVQGSEEDLLNAHELIKVTQLNMSRKFREQANKNRNNVSVAEGSLVWVRNERPLPGTSQKLNCKWLGPYKVTEVIRDGGSYRLKNVFDQRVIQRAAEKIKPYCGEEQWLLMPQEVVVPENDFSEHLPPRQRVPPRRLIEEC